MLLIVSMCGLMGCNALINRVAYLSPLESNDLVTLKQNCLGAKNYRVNCDKWDTGVSGTGLAFLLIILCP